MQKSTRPPNFQAKEPWGRPNELLTDRARSFDSASLRKALTEIENGPARDLDPRS